MFLRFRQISVASILTLAAIASPASPSSRAATHPLALGDKLLAAINPLLAKSELPEMTVVESALGIKFRNAEVVASAGATDSYGDAMVGAIASSARVTTSVRTSPALTRNSIDISKITCVSPVPFKEAFKGARINRGREGTDGFIQPDTEVDYAGETSAYLWHITVHEAGNCIESLYIFLTKKNK